MQNARGNTVRRGHALRILSAGRSGYTTLEVLFALALMVTLGAAAAPPLLASVDEARAAGAVRFVATKLQQARVEAVVRSADVGWQFLDVEGGYSWVPYVDGNGNGVRTRDIQRAVDRRIGAPERLADHFQGVDFGLMPGLPAIDPGGAAPGSDPIKLGSSDILTFTPLGTASAGSLYLRSRRNVQYAIRVLGETGRTRVLKFDARTQQWRPA